MDLAVGGTMTDDEFAARRDLAAFRPFPFFLDPPAENPAIPDGFRVAIVGSGFAGIAAAIQCELLGLPYVVLERRSEPGGVWTINRYPDVRVDTASITYEYSFEKLYPWSEHFGRGEQVRAYLDHVSRKYGVRANTRFDTDLRRATFDEAAGLWRLELQTSHGVERMDANFVISAAGTFANPKSRISRQGEFRRNDRPPVAMAGRPGPDRQACGDHRQRLHRRADAGRRRPRRGAGPCLSAHAAMDQPARQIRPADGAGAALAVRQFPGLLELVALHGDRLAVRHPCLPIPDPAWQAGGGKVNPANDQLRETLTRYIHAETGGRQDLIDRLIPDYAPFSRRPVVDNGWYRALTRDNVELVCGEIERLTPAGIVSADGTERAVDVIISATGFDIVKYLWPARYTGRGGKDLHETWESGDGPRAYLGMMAPDFPNLFMLYGPNSQPLSGGTGLPQWFAVWASYAAQCILRALADGKRAVSVKPEAFARYNEALDAEAAPLLQLTPEGGVEKNYYVNQQHNRLQMNAPWLSHDFHRMCTVVDWEDLEIV